jgi:16S rRNA (adenine1518-N6/adenine1519-N6)-dimethyltransferase
MSDESRGSRLPPPRKRLGQHFLTDTRTLDRIADVLEITKQDTVIEIGPGRGALTDRLAARAGRLIAIEVDKLLIPILRARYADQPHVSIIESDVLDLSLGDVAGGPYLLAGNVPYYITTPIIFHALHAPRPHSAVYLVQKEVADRVAAAPGSEMYGALSVNVQALAKAERLFTVGKGAFQPPPSVESAVIRLTPREDPVIPSALEHEYQRFVIAAFGNRRKQMKRVLREVTEVTAEQAEQVLAAAEVPVASRPEVLSPADFARVLAQWHAIAPVVLPDA